MIDERHIGAAVTRALEACRPLTELGRVADYIPQLQTADGSALGVCVATAAGGLFAAGDAYTPFTIQSVSKVLILTAALMDTGEAGVLDKVSFEPSADGFNSIVNLEVKNYNKPLNPMINSGAIACLSLVAGETAYGRYQRILGLARALSGDETVDMDEAVYLSEKQTGARNRALAYYMKSTGVIDGDVEALLDAYFRVCSIRMDCALLARMALVYASHGIGPWGLRLVPPQVARMVNATITLCGMYDESGKVAVRVGLPAKSGVGGGILAVVPGRMGIGLYGPALNPKGSSMAGLALLEQLARELGLGIF